MGEVIMTNRIEKQDILTGYNNIKKIIDILLKTNQVKYVASAIAPSTYKGMVAYYNDFGQYLVYNGGDHGFLGEEFNVKFRALHDAMHRENELTFKFEDEKKLSDITKRIFQDLAWHTLNLTAFEVYVIGEIINAEIKGQIEYYEKNNSYVQDQREFILDYLRVAA